MSTWGRGIFQCESDLATARWITELAGYNIVCPNDFERSWVIKQLEAGDLEELDRIITTDASSEFLWVYIGGRLSQPTRASPMAAVARCRIILLLLAMQLGVKMDEELLRERKSLYSSLPNPIQELQFLTAANSYKNNGTPWILGSKNYHDTMLARNYTGKYTFKFDCGDELWFSGLRHSADEKPSDETQSESCHRCHGELGRIQGSTIRCKTCKMVRWCSYWCWSNARERHSEVCFAAEKRFVAKSVPEVADLQPLWVSLGNPHDPEYSKSYAHDRDEAEIVDLQPSRVSRDKPPKLAYSKADMNAADNVYLGGPINGVFPKI